MKKILCLISLFVIVLSSAPDTRFSLLEHFEGEYTAYSHVPLSENCINLGTCYMNIGKVEGELIGESMVIYDFEVSSAIDELNAEVVKTEILADGTSVIYCYSNLIDSYVKVDNKKVNLQIAHNDEYSVIGWPLILGSF